MVADTPEVEAFRHAPAAYAVDTGDSVVVLDRATGEMHQLDAAAAAIWREVDGRATAPQIVERVAAEHGLQPDDIAAEVHAGLRELLDAGLLREDAGQVAPPTPARRLVPPAQAPAPVAHPTPVVPGAAVAARCLQLDLAAVEVIAGLRNLHIDPILLKGPALAWWLYGGYGERRYGDLDLLVPPEAVDLAEDLLKDRGFARRYVSLPQTVPFHATAWFRDSDRVEIDLHDRLWGCGRDPAAQWEVLAAHREPLELIGIPVDVPDVPSRLLHLCLHIAQSYPGRRKKVEDLQRAMAAVTFDDWSEARRLAAELDAEVAMGAGLRLLEPGRALADRLDLPSGLSTELVLRGVGADNATVSILHLFRARSPGEALRFAFRRVFPPPEFMRQEASVPIDSTAGLARAYLARVWSILRRAARAVPVLLRAWRDTQAPGR